MSEPPTRVVVKGIDVPFLDLVTLLVKVAIAAAPATIIVAVVVALAMGAVASLAIGR